MKTLFIGLSLLLSSQAFSHEIKGTLILKGVARTKVMVRGIETTCSVRVRDVKNTMTEDSYQNPAYRVWTEVSLSGRAGGERINHKQDIRFTNLHKEVNGTIVLDNEYVGEDVVSSNLTIDDSGRIRSVIILFEGRNTRCSF